ncbi:43572_t:CDS:1, partial [Gigaspora margarita]
FIRELLYNFEIILKFLGINQTLTTLILNLIGFESCIGKKIAKLLCKNNTLKRLELNGNEITFDDENAIFNSSCENTSLTHLDISSNLINNNSCLELKQMFQKNTTLISLNLSNNLLGESGDLIEGLDGNTNLKYLYLRNNKFSVEIVHSFISYLLNNATLKHLDLSFNLELEDIPPIQQYIKQEKYVAVLPRIS